MNGEASINKAVAEYMRKDKNRAVRKDYTPFINWGNVTDWALLRVTDCKDSTDGVLLALYPHDPKWVQFQVPRYVTIKSPGFSNFIKRLLKWGG